MTWYTLYDLFYPKLKQNETFEEAMRKFLFTVMEVTNCTIFFKLSVTLSVIKQKIANQKCKYLKTCVICNVATYLPKFCRLKKSGGQNYGTH